MQTRQGPNPGALRFPDGSRLSGQSICMTLAALRNAPRVLRDVAVLRCRIQGRTERSRAAAALRVLRCPPGAEVAIDQIESPDLPRESVCGKRNNVRFLGRFT